VAFGNLVLRPNFYRACGSSPEDGNGQETTLSMRTGPLSAKGIAQVPVKDSRTDVEFVVLLRSLISSLLALHPAIRLVIRPHHLSSKSKIQAASPANCSCFVTVNQFHLRRRIDHFYFRCRANCRIANFVALFRNSFNGIFRLRMLLIQSKHVMRYLRTMRWKLNSSDDIC
jgi:hypothetical protein